MLCLCGDVLVFLELLVCVQTTVFEVSDDWSVEAPFPPKWKLTRCGAREFGDTF